MGTLRRVLREETRHAPALRAYLSRDEPGRAQKRYDAYHRHTTHSRVARVERPALARRRHTSSNAYASTMVTSTSTPGSMEMEVICLTIVRRRVQVDEALVHAELEAVPGVGTFTARRLANGELEHLGGHADGALDLEALLLGAADEVRAHLLEVGDVLGGERDADAVHALLGSVLLAGAGSLVGADW